MSMPSNRFVLTKAPYRVSILGGGTDLPEAYKILDGGTVVSFTINHGIFANLSRRPDKKFRISSGLGTQEVNSLDEIKHGLVREAFRLRDLEKPENGIEINFTGQLPGNIGLSSSAAVAVATLAAIDVYLGKRLSPEELAQDAYIVEREMLGKKCGKQDQYASAYGGLNFLRFLPDGRVNVIPILLSNKNRERIEKSLILYRTEIERSKPAAESLSSQAGRVQVNKNYLQGLKELAEEGYSVLTKPEPDLDQIGYLLDKNWQLKRQLGDVTNPTIDRLYEIAKDEGASGAKISGAGLGGVLLVYIPSNLEPLREDFDTRFRKISERDGISLEMIPYKIETVPRGATLCFVQ